MASLSRITAVPLANVRPSADGTQWQSDSNDPQFALRWSAGEQHHLRGGWYRFRVRLSPAAVIHAPCLYVDYGAGISERSKVDLPLPGEDGRIDAVVLLHSDAYDVRFDPTDRAGAFEVSEFAMERRSRAWALYAMIRAICAANQLPWWRVFAGAVGRFCINTATRGLRAGADYVRQRYEQSLANDADEYRDWVRQYDTIDAKALQGMTGRIAALSARPLISVLLPTYNSPERWLRRALDSVIEQAYPEWELCIADDASTKRHVRRVLEEYAVRDRRIRVVFRTRNGHISAASNSALEIARGEFVALLDHDDELPPHALLEVAESIGQHPEWKLIYSDEDKIDERGRRFDPYFKPDWNYDLFLGQNCISHLGVYRTDLVRSVGGFREGFEGSQDWDLALRVTEQLGDGEIGHIPKVLYHWRAISGSTAVGLDQKNYALDAGKRAIKEHLGRVGCEAEVTTTANGHVRVRRRLPACPPMVSLVVPTRDRVDLLRVCVESILTRTDYPLYELIIVDNQSTEVVTHEFLSHLSSDPRVRVLSYDRPFNYSAINNFAVDQARGELIGLINNDIEVISSDWLDEMVAHAVRPDVGAVGAMLYYPNDTIQHAGVVTGLWGVAGHLYVGKDRGCIGQMGRGVLVQELSAVTAACLLVRRSVFQEVDGLDEGLRVAFNDVDFCLRVRKAGYRNIWTPFAELYHHESASRGHEDSPEKQTRFQSEVEFMRARWGELLERDTAYNPNLSLTSAKFDLAHPPRIRKSSEKPGRTGGQVSEPACP